MWTTLRLISLTIDSPRGGVNRPEYSNQLNTMSIMQCSSEAEEAPHRNKAITYNMENSAYKNSYKLLILKLNNLLLDENHLINSIHHKGFNDALTSIVLYTLIM